MTSSPKNIQLVFDFDTVRSTSFIEEAHRAVAISGRQRKYIAADLGMTESELSKKLSGVENRDIGIRQLEDFFDSLGDAATIPVKYLAFKYLARREDQKALAAKALSEFTGQIPAILRIAEMLAAQEKGGKR